MALKLVIGCQHYLFAEGLKKLLENDREINIIGLFNEGIDLKEIVKLKPDTILADFGIFYGLPENFITDNHLKIILIDNRIGLYTMNERMPELISRGVVGIIPAGADSGLLKKAVKAVSSGELWIDRKTIKNILSPDSQPLSRKEANFTRKENETLTLICRGYRNKEIAHKLNVGEQTVKSHLNRIYKKIGVSDRLQLALYCYNNGVTAHKSIKT